MATILVIEDDDSVRTLLRTTLTSAGYIVQEAVNGRQGIRAFRRAPMDLVITDLYMPDRDGLEVIEARWLFDLAPEQVQIVVHPQSIVHSIVEYVDGSMIAQLSPPDTPPSARIPATFRGGCASPAAR